MKLKTRSVVHGTHVYFIVQDPMAGHRHVYTVYKIRLSGDKAATIVGRELPLPAARRVIQQHEGASFA